MVETSWSWLIMLRSNPQEQPSCGDWTNHHVFDLICSMRPGIQIIQLVACSSFHLWSFREFPRPGGRSVSDEGRNDQVGQSEKDLWGAMGASMPCPIEHWLSVGAVDALDLFTILWMPKISETMMGSDKCWWQEWLSTATIRLENQSSRLWFFQVQCRSGQPVLLKAISQ